MVIEETAQKEGITTEEATDMVVAGLLVNEMADTFGVTPDEAIAMIIVVEVVEAVAEDIAKEEGKTTEQVLSEMGTMIDEAIPDTQVVSAIEKALGALLSAGPTPAPTAVKKIGEHITDMISNQLTP